MIEEVIPGVLHWSAMHDGIRQIVHSSFVVGSGTLIDPMVPAEGVDWFTARHPPERILLSNRHHYRHSARFVERYGCTVHCHEAGLHEFGPDRPVRGFRFGDALAPDVTAVELDAICPEETVLHIEAGEGVLSFADGVIRDDQGELAFVPDFLLGDDPEQVKRDLRAGLSRLTELPFDAMLLAHGAPLTSGARQALADFLAG